MSLCLDLAAPTFISERDPGDEHIYPPALSMTECPECGAPRNPEPTESERELIWADPYFVWQEPVGDFLRTGYGLAGRGHGVYVICDRCDFFLKDQGRD